MSTSVFRVRVLSLSWAWGTNEGSFSEQRLVSFTGLINLELRPDWSLLRVKFKFSDQHPQHACSYGSSSPEGGEAQLQLKWLGRHGQVKSTYKPSGSLSRFLTRNISTQPPLDGMLVHRRVTPSIKFAGTHFGWREALWEWSLFPKNTTQCPPPGLESGLLDPESSSLTMRPPRIFFSPLTWNVSPRKFLFLWLRLFSLRDMQFPNWVPEAFRRSLTLLQTRKSEATTVSQVFCHCYGNRILPCRSSQISRKDTGHSNSTEKERY